MLSVVVLYISWYQILLIPSIFTEKGKTQFLAKRP
jgi:hypothetical protein